MSDDTVNFEVDGKPVQGRRGQMVMEVTDSLDVYVPRFCYHKKLSIAASCRMCLVEVEKAPKPLPACATPITEGMKVFTRSPRAIAAQRATMEFLLINHPLDCPICDQGGECELQDLAMGYGRDISRYNLGKRSVKDEDLGPLVSTDMTRCIHCTRCVRFGQEVAGIRELGTMGRGEWMRISTYIGKTVDHELSGNIIDLCPVGALNNKPYRYSARAWEMMQRATVSPHDCVGTNMYVHTLRGRIKRVVPRENEAINETWIADRDRYSYEGVYAPDRLTAPRVKADGTWRDIGWEEALELAAGRLKAAGAKTGILASPSSTVEEAWLAARIAEGLGTANVDHRLRRQDFADQENDPLLPWLGCDIADLEYRDGMLIVGSDLRRETPMIAHRVRKGVLTGAKVAFVHPERHHYYFDADYLDGGSMAEELAGIAAAAAGERALPAPVAALCAGVEPAEHQRRAAQMLAEAETGLVLLGLDAARDTDFSAVRALAAAVAELTGASLGYLSEGANTAGAHLAGLLPHRGTGGEARSAPGLHAGEMADADLDAMLLLNVEPWYDLAHGQLAAAALARRPFVAALTPYASPDLLEAADLLLPVGTFAETSGTYVNCEGRWQSFGGVASPVGESRPAWKVLRVLGNLLDLDGFEYLSSEAVSDELRSRLGEIAPDNRYRGTAEVRRASDPGRRVHVPMYGVDAVVRRAEALQLTREARRDAAAVREEAAG